MSTTDQDYKSGTINSSLSPSPWYVAHMQGKYGSDTEARASFRYRLREAARQALTLGDALLQLSQDAVEPDDTELSHLRDLEGSLNYCHAYKLPCLKK